ncbi:hypothetical protein J2Z62_000115 [Mycoplasmoides fastidiosum]|uniref:Uncharacterized protein n=1 Tax=Mycoplasmoides fastidiosum TaxID=92758 RepID=A0ABU0LYC4_9BACT|nr:hypothetical protein [Mycoplasmoides fastidiosum]MDQ0513677.1 hypothetical protein [Mycoplasmoides fastidiosum]UUD37904.1 hypothetical protein NPA10_00710 [Mycoplasmoides fastidiosum]
MYRTYLPGCKKPKPLRKACSKQKNAVVQKTCSGQRIVPVNKNHSKNNLKRNIGKMPVSKIVSGRIFKITDKAVYVCFEDKIGICPLHHVTDFPNRVPDLMKLNVIQNFLILTNIKERIQVTKLMHVDSYWLLSYKRIHPEELRQKKRPIPTASHYRHLSRTMSYWLSRPNYPGCWRTEVINFEMAFKKTLIQNQKTNSVQSWENPPASKPKQQPINQKNLLANEN